MGAWSEKIDVGKVPENGTNFDVIVVGGGPGGSAAASYHSMNGQKVLLLEKEIWPRDKICGDAVGGKSLRHVKELGVKTMIFIMALRFLTDFLNGDTYYKTAYSNHNLDRSKNQFKLIESLMENFDQMEISSTE